MDAEGRYIGADSRDAVHLAILVDDSFQVSLSLVDVDKHSIKVLEFVDTKFLVGLEAALVQLLPETGSDIDLKILVVLPRNDINRKKVVELLDVFQMSYIEGNRDVMHEKSLERDLLEVLLKQKLNHYLKKTRNFERALDLTLYLCIVQRIVEDNTNHGIFGVELLDVCDFMKLDMNAIVALNIAPRNELITKADKEKDLCILSLLDNCKTKMGPKCLRRWVLQPLIEKSRIEQRLDLVEFLVVNKPFYDFMSNSFLTRICDLDKIATKLFKVKQNKITNGSLSDICKLYQVIQMCKSAQQFINDQIAVDSNSGFGSRVSREGQTAIPESTQISRPSAEHSPFAHRLSRVQLAFGHCLDLFSNYCETIEKHVDMSRVERGEYFVRPESNPGSADVMKDIKIKKDELAEAVRRVEIQLGTQVTLERDAAGHYLVKAPKKVERNLGRVSSSSSSIKVVTARANHMMLSNMEIKSISIDLVSLEAEYKLKQEDAAFRIVEIVSSYFEAVEQLAEFLGEFDAVCSLAQFSMPTIDCLMVRPTFNDGSRLVMKNSRHPILDKMQPNTTVPNDCFMEKDNSSFHVITGPNMGGKSTFIRQVAINIILAQIGCFCCAEMVEIPVFTSLVTRVGASDTQAKGLSTWMSELLEVSSMLESATGRTFLVIDELGRGTSTSEGIGMTRAVAEDIIDRLDSYCLFATHFFELVKLEDDRAQVKNYHAEAEVKDGTVEMSYRIKHGYTDKSLGVHILSMLSFPKSIFNFAKELSDNLGNLKLLDVQSENIERPQASSSKPKARLFELSFEEKITSIKTFKKLQFCILNDPVESRNGTPSTKSSKLRQLMQSYR